MALGFKAETVKEYFLHYRSLNADFTVNLSSGEVDPHEVEDIDWRVTLVDTGFESMTGGRVKRMQSFIGNETFMLTYGDGVADIDMNVLVDFHKNHGKMVTVTAVHPVARFGELELDGECVKSFQEKPQVASGWINGGYFVCQPEFFDLVQDDSTILEREPLENVAKGNQLMAYKHKSFWQCMDTKRDKDLLEDLWQQKKAPWLI